MDTVYEFLLTIPNQDDYEKSFDERIDDPCYMIPPPDTIKGIVWNLIRFVKNHFILKEDMEYYNGYVVLGEAHIYNYDKSLLCLIDKELIDGEEGVYLVNESHFKIVKQINKQ